MNSRRSRSSGEQPRLRGNGLAGLGWKIKVGPSFNTVKKKTGMAFYTLPSS